MKLLMLAMVAFIFSKAFTQDSVSIKKTLESTFKLTSGVTFDAYLAHPTVSGVFVSKKSPLHKKHMENVRFIPAEYLSTIEINYRTTKGNIAKGMFLGGATFFGLGFLLWGTWCFDRQDNGGDCTFIDRLFNFNRFGESTHLRNSIISGGLMALLGVFLGAKAATVESVKFSINGNKNKLSPSAMQNYLVY